MLPRDLIWGGVLAARFRLQIWQWIISFPSGLRGKVSFVAMQNLASILPKAGTLDGPEGSSRPRCGSDVPTLDDSFCSAAQSELACPECCLRAPVMSQLEAAGCSPHPWPGVASPEVKDKDIFRRASEKHLAASRGLLRLVTYLRV